MTEATTEKVDTPEASKTEAASKKAPTRRTPAKKPAAKPRKKAQVADLTAENLVDQKDGTPRPLSATTENLQASIRGDMGRVLVSLSQKDYVGAEPVVLLAANADEFREIADELDRLADERLAEK